MIIGSVGLTGGGPPGITGGIVNPDLGAHRLKTSSNDKTSFNLHINTLFINKHYNSSDSKDSVKFSGVILFTGEERLGSTGIYSSMGVGLSTGILVSPLRTLIWLITAKLRTANNRTTLTINKTLINLIFLKIKIVKY